MGIHKLRCNASRSYASCQYLRLCLTFFSLFCYSLVANATIHVVAAENVYGNIANMLGGEWVQVYNVLNNPNQDPHLYTIDIKAAKAIAQADIVIYNGAGYDPWMTPLLRNAAKDDGSAIIIANFNLPEFQPNDPHFWYLPKTMRMLAKQLLNQYQLLDPGHSNEYLQHYQQLCKNLVDLERTIRELKPQLQGKLVAATEPVANYLLHYLGLKIMGLDFQQAMMNDIPPSMAQMINFKNNLTNHLVNALIYNAQVNNTVSKQMIEMATTLNIPSIGVSEMLPADMNYQTFILITLNHLSTALIAK
jgi:zinc/manganese transport system substrate-binding protein